MGGREGERGGLKWPITQVLRRQGNPGGTTSRWLKLEKRLIPANKNSPPMDYARVTTGFILNSKTRQTPNLVKCCVLRTLYYLEHLPWGRCTNKVQGEPYFSGWVKAKGSQHGSFRWTQQPLKPPGMASPSQWFFPIGWFMHDFPLSFYNCKVINTGQFISWR